MNWDRGDGQTGTSPMSSNFEGQEIGGGFRLVNRIARGHQVEIWEVEGPGGVRAAAKIYSGSLTDGIVQRAIECADKMKTLRHPNLIANLAFWAFEDQMILIQELAKGSLRT